MEEGYRSSNSPSLRTPYGKILLGGSPPGPIVDCPPEVYSGPAFTEIRACTLPYPLESQVNESRVRLR